VPWHVTRTPSQCSASKPWAVIKDSDGTVEGCHATEQDAQDQMAALYANEPKASDQMTTTLGGKPNPGTNKDKRLKENSYDMKCPPGMVPDETGDGCIEEKPAADAETVTLAVADPAAEAQWRGCMIVEGTPTGDRREFAPDSITWPDPSAVPMTLQWQKESSHGGDHDVTVAVGRIDRVWRDGTRIMGEGRFDTHPDAVEAKRRMDDGMLNGVSINADDITDSEIEYVWPQGDPESEADDEAGDEVDIMELLFGQPEKVIFHAARLRAVTLCDIPAYVEATIHAVEPGVAPTVTASASAPARAVAVHESEISHELWDGATQEAKLRSTFSYDTATGAYAFVDSPPEEMSSRNNCRFLHHEITDAGTAGPANISACLAMISVVHGSRIPDQDKAAVYNHLAAHLRTAGEEPPPYEPQHALVAHAWQEDQGFHPSPDWFADPELKVATPIMVTDAGRVFGLATEWGECHLGFNNECVLPPRETYHSHFMTGELPYTCSDGSRPPVGQITAGIGHAPMTMTANRAAEHYENTDAVVADVSVGNCKTGIWVAGAIRPTAQASRVQALRASGQVSPDWRRIGGQLRMIALLTVNVSGYQIPRVRTRVASGQIQAMVASGLVSVHVGGPSNDDLDRRALRLMMDRLAERVHS
jgi:hypothetical protein